MANRFLHIGINFRTANDMARIQGLGGLMDSVAPDWLRYAPNNWIVYTDKTAQQMTEILRPWLPTDDFLILPIDESQGCQGWVPQLVWDWINQPRNTGWKPPTPYPTNPWGTAPTPPPFSPLRKKP